MPQKKGHKYKYTKICMRVRHLLLFFATATCCRKITNKNYLKKNKKTFLLIKKSKVESDISSVRHIVQRFSLQLKINQTAT